MTIYGYNAWYDARHMVSVCCNEGTMREGRLNVVSSQEFEGDLVSLAQMDLAQAALRCRLSTRFLWSEVESID